MNYVLQANSLTKKYRGFQALNGLTMHVPKGSIYSFVGKNGAGRKNAKHFSLGMKQRLGIAVALAGDPDFLVLDEPVNGLDPQGIVEMRELILKLNRERQITVLISSHILDELSRLATHYGIIDNGRMVKELSAGELDAACRKCVRMEVTDTSVLARVLDCLDLEYKIMSATTADVFAKINVTHLVLALAKEGCEVLSIQEKDESLESYYILYGVAVAALVSVFTGTDFSDGFIRNKLLLCKSRSHVLFSHIIVNCVACIIIYLIVSAFAAGAGLFFFENDVKTETFLYYLFLGIGMSAAYGCVFSVVTLLCGNKTSAVIWCMGMAMVMLFLSLHTNQLLVQTEFKNGLPNPHYAGGFRRALYGVLHDLNPCGQAAQLSSWEVWNPVRVVICNLLWMLAASTAGCLRFNKKDVKKVYFLYQSAREITEALDDRLTTDTNTLIDLSSRDRGMRKLASKLNTQLRFLHQERRRYQQGDLELKEAVTNISHDLRTPLTAISGYLDLLDREPKSEAVSRYLSLIHNRTDVLKNLTEELFRYSVVTSSQELKLERMNVVRALEESLLTFYAAMQAQGIRPEIELPEEPVFRELDEGAVNRVFSNIISNALKYSDGDLSVVMDRDGCITFSNAARKLNAVTAGRLFDRFYTVEASRNSTGLGLSIAKILTERMGGKIDADYRDGKLMIKIDFLN